MLRCTALVLVLVGAAVGGSGSSRGRRSASVPDGAEVSLTRLISSGNIAAAQNAAYVYPPLFGVTSYAHYFTVNDKYNSNIFFWYFPVTTSDPNAPLVLWMQGGPGTSSLLGLFTEHGPVSIDENLNPIPRDLAWNKRYNLLYFDNPVGAGFSYTEDDAGYSNNMVDVGTNLYEALIQFLTLFPELQSKPLFITGESYAGKYVPTLGHFIHMNNPSATLKVNLSGLAWGNGFTDPPLMMDYHSHLFQIGLLDEMGKIEFEAAEAKILSLIALNRWKDAAYAYGDMIAGDPLKPYNTLFTNLTGFTYVYNYLYQAETPRYWIDYVSQKNVSDALHVYGRPYNRGNEVKEHFLNDLLKSVKPWVEELLNEYRVLIYIGQLDCLIPSKQVHDYMRTLVFPGALEYKTSKRYKWMVGDTIGGYVRTGGHLTDLVVRDAGHMVPLDQPELGWDLIDRFIKNKSFKDKP